MTRDKLVAEARRIVAEHLEVDAAKVTDDAHLVDDLGADSLDQVELTMTMEELFQVAIEDNEVEGINTFGDLVKLVASKMAVTS